MGRGTESFNRGGSCEAIRSAEKGERHNDFLTPALGKESRGVACLRIGIRSRYARQLLGGPWFGALCANDAAVAKITSGLLLVPGR